MPTAPVPCGPILRAIGERAASGGALTYAAVRCEARGLLRRAERAYGGWRVAVAAALAALGAEIPALRWACDELQPPPAPPTPGTEGARLRAARGALGMTQREAARRLGVAGSTWCLYERGRRAVPGDAWQAVGVAQPEPGQDSRS